MKDEITITIEVPAEMMLLRPLNHFVRHIVRQVPALARDDELVNNLELAFDEAFTNIHRHAYRCNERGLVNIQIRIDSSKLEFRFEDRGECFDPLTVPDPDLSEPREGGLGVWLMRQVMDEFIYYSQADGKNVLRLIKRLPVCEK
ncbi:MAG: ATP-binding protein [Deltaproteobacteria bacterium]|nr:ATP-binding protein [Deltaproteobacteria bacterium]